MRRIDILIVLFSLMVVVGLGAGMAVSASPQRMASPSLTALAAAPELPELREATVGPVRTLDPLYAETPAERAIGALLFRGLTRAGPDGSVLPDLAERWEVDDGGAVVTFHLRPDARWHDGVHVTADDVMFTYGSLADPAYEGSAVGEWANVQVRRVDRFTLELRSSSVRPVSLALARQPILPAHLLEGVPLAERAAHPFGRAPVGNGPFALVELSEGEALLERVGAPPGGLASDYASGPLARMPEPTPREAPHERAALHRYRFLIQPDQDAAVAAFADGMADAIAGLGPDDLERLIAEPGVRALAFPGTRSLALVPNMRFATGPLRDAQVRRALSLAIDRDAIVRSAFAGSGLAAQSVVSPASHLHGTGSPAAPAVDAAAAQAGLLAAGWTEGAGGWSRPGSSEPVSIELLVRDTQAAPQDRAVADLVAEDWRSIGLSVNVVPLPPEELVRDHLRPGLFDVALLEVDLGLDPDPTHLFASSQAVVGGSNLGGYQSSLMDRLLEDLHGAAPDERPRRFAALQTALSREMPAIPLVFPDDVFLVRDEIQGVETRQVADARDRYSDVLAWRLAQPHG